MRDLTMIPLGSLCLAFAMVVGIPAVSQAKKGTYDFTAPPKAQAPSLTYDSTPSGAGTITATAEKCAPLCDPDLFVTTGVGLGIVDTANDNRITSSDFVQLDLINLKIPPLTSPRLSFRAAGIIAGGVWEVFGSNEAGTFECEGCAEILSGTTSDLVPDLGEDIIGSFRYLDITAASGGVLLNEIDVTFTPPVPAPPVPEPTSLALLAVGLVAYGMIRWKLCPLGRP